MKRLALMSAALFVLSIGSAAATHSGFVVTPAKVAAGSVVRVSAAASPCRPGDAVTLISRAFRGHAFGGQGAVTGLVRARGAFAVSTRIRSSLAPGRYGVTARCGGGNLPTSAFFRVVAARHVSVAVYLVRGESVSPARRVVARTPAVARTALGELLRGPTATERAQGYGSAVPAGTRLRGVSLAHGVLTVDLSRRFESGGGSLSMLLRVAQVVYTATRFPSVDSVAFRLDGKAVQAIGGEGVVVAPSVTRSDFEGQAPKILVEQPLPGDRVSRPLVVRGSANVFEAQFSVDVETPGGKVLVHRIVYGGTGDGRRGPFEVRVPLAASRTRVVVVAFDRSAKDGSRIDMVRVPVTLR